MTDKLKVTTKILKLLARHAPASVSENIDLATRPPHQALIAEKLGKRLQY